MDRKHLESSKMWKELQKLLKSSISNKVDGTENFALWDDSTSQETEEESNAIQSPSETDKENL